MHSIIINDDNGSLEVKYTGEISFNEEETAIRSISRDGYLKFKKNGRKLVVTADDNGLPVYEINGADKKNTLNDDEKAFLTEAIKVMIEYGVGAKDRVERIHKKGGSKAVMEETKNMKSDYVKSIYLEYLLETNTLSPTEMTEIANNVQFLIKSDFEKGKLLKKFSSKYLANDATAHAYLGAVKSISSDFEKAGAVKVILNQTLTQEQFLQVMEVANSIGSDFEKANVLKEVIANNKISPNEFSEVLHAASRIGSDFEKANVLKQIVKNDKLPEEQFTETLSVVTSVGSDFEKANVLKQIAGTEMKEESQWISLIGSTEKVSSDFEKSNVLSDIAVKMPPSENVKSAYMKAAKTISSDYDYGRAIRAIK
jgi:deoxyribose-phosphate aldolase